MERSITAARSPSMARWGALQWGVTDRRSPGVPSSRSTGRTAVARRSRALRNRTLSPLMTFVHTSSTDPFRSTTTGDPGEA